MAKKKKTREGAGKVVSHPLRFRLLGEYAKQQCSPSDLASALGEAIGNVSYHTRILAREGAIKLVRTKQIRGAVEHYYEADVWGLEILRMFAPEPADHLLAAIEVALPKRAVAARDALSELADRLSA